MLKSFSPALFRYKQLPKHRRLISLCCTFHQKHQKLSAHTKEIKPKNWSSRECHSLAHWGTVHWFHRAISHFLLKNPKIQRWKIKASLTATLFPWRVLNNNLCHRYFHCYTSTVTFLNYVLEMVQACLTCFPETLGVLLERERQQGKRSEMEQNAPICLCKNCQSSKPVL